MRSIPIYVGTCGYSYADWKGPFYPPALRAAEMLPYYAARFRAVEIDATYYRVLGAKTFASMAARTPCGFRFAVKLPGSVTHVPAGSTPHVHPDAAAWREGIEPLVAAGKFAAGLMQFPNGFKPTAGSEAYLRALVARLEGLPLVAEFRNREWQAPGTLALLRELGVAWTNVDEPQFRTLLRPSSDVTSPLAYVRFHGRNYAQWWKGDNATRYDYLYSTEELVPWVERVIDLAAQPDVREVYAYFNNHRAGNAVRNAETFEAMLAAKLGDSLA
ncbi:MAG: DUF72 domain-containing protein [Candidatus Eremiobacteraeota bacterium]|nr:DUF72 domain-containing protein [Candidatus Eremiobacteraeota bacterium]